MSTANSIILYDIMGELVDKILGTPDRFAIVSDNESTDISHENIEFIR